jgi:putative nucleotidyltransferase with HDIG domain
MQTDQLQRICDWVEVYARAGDGVLPAAVALKLDHTRRVAETARDIARDLDWNPDEVRLAEAIGWLHDIGRFAQFAEFGHFHDATSFNHGHRGAEIVRDSGLLDSLDDESRTTLLDGIRHHNAKRLPEELPPAGLPFLQLIRDADKLDIFHVVAEGLERDGFRELANLWPHIDLDGPVNPLLIREIHARREGDVAHVQSLADFLLLEASWLYDLHFAPSRERARRARVLDTLAARLPGGPDIRAVLDDIRRFLAQDAPPDPFEEHADLYEAWFERHPSAYASELAAVRELWPTEAYGLEIGVGAGHFARPLGIRHGVDPAAAMRKRAAARGIEVLDAPAEHLPYPDSSFDAVLMVTAICFVADPARSLREMHRVLRPGGHALVGFVDPDSPLGREYRERRNASRFYREARFLGTAELFRLLESAGFVDLETRQTVFTHPDRMPTPDPVRPGFGQGSFVVIRGHKPETLPC